MFVFLRIVGDRRVRGNREKSRNLPGTLRIRSRQNSRYQKCWLRHKMKPFLYVVRSLMVGSSFLPKDALFSKGRVQKRHWRLGARKCVHASGAFIVGSKCTASIKLKTHVINSFLTETENFSKNSSEAFESTAFTSESHIFVMNRSLVQRHSLSFLLLPLLPFLFPSHVVRHQGSLGTVLVVERNGQLVTSTGG